MSDIQYDPACRDCREAAGKPSAKTTWQCAAHVIAERDEAMRRVDIAHEGTSNAWAETERQHERLAVCELMLDSIEGLATGQPGVDPTEVADGWSTALAAVQALVAERDRLREALRDAISMLENGDFANGVTHFGIDEGVMAAIDMVERIREALGGVKP